MSMSARAAQFAPFAALSGFDAVLREAAQKNQNDIELSESALELLDRRLRRLIWLGDKGPAVTLTAYLPAEERESGRFVLISGRVLGTDYAGAYLLLDSGETVPVSSVRAVTGDAEEDVEEYEWT